MSMSNTGRGRGWGFRLLDSHCDLFRLSIQWGIRASKTLRNVGKLIGIIMQQKESHVKVLESTPLRGCRNHENVRQQEIRVAMIIS
jgi:hypothetical protein